MKYTRAHAFRYILDPERHQLVEYNYGSPAKIEAAPNPAPSRWWSCHLASNSSNNNSNTSATLTRQQQQQQQQHNLGTFYCPNRRQDEGSSSLRSIPLPKWAECCSKFIFNFLRGRLRCVAWLPPFHSIPTHPIPLGVQVRWQSTCRHGSKRPGSGGQLVDGYEKLPAWKDSRSRDTATSESWQGVAE